MRQHALHVALAVVVLAVAAGAAAIAPGAAASGLAGPAEPTADGRAGRSVAQAGSAVVQAGSAVADGTEPTLSAPNDLNRTANLTATVALPADATERRELVVRVDAVGGSTITRQSVTLDPGEARTLDFGACLPDGNLVVRVLSRDEEILVANAVEVQRATPVVSLPSDGAVAYEPSVRRNETLRVNATYHGCSDRATFQLDGFSDDEQVRWLATVVDADDDGSVSFAWDVDAPAGERLRAGEDGTGLVNASANATPPYGAYSLTVRSEGDEVARGSVTVSFADPEIRVYTADGRKTAMEALAAARRGESVGDNGRAAIVDDDWVVLRVDTDGTLEALPGNASLVAPERHEDVTVRLRERYGVHADGDRVPDLANATRRFDPETGTLWYAYRADARNANTAVEYVAIGDAWNATADVEVDPVDPVSLQLSGGNDDMLPSTANVTVEGHSPLPAGTTLTAAVRVGDRVVATDDVAVDDERGFRPTFDLSGVANGTNATLTVTEDGRRIHEQPVRVVSKPVLSLRGFHVEDGLVAGEPVTVRVYLSNRGTDAGRGTVTVRIGDETRTERTRVPRGESVVVRVPVETGVVPNREQVEVAASFAGETESRVVEVDTTRTTPADPITSTPPSTTSTGTEPWPTLAGGPRTTSNSPLPGFGVLVAAVALATTGVLVRRRSRGDDR